MNHHAKKHLHEKNRQRHKYDMQQQAREAARRGRSKLPFWLLIGGIGLLIAGLAVLLFR